MRHAHFEQCRSVWKTPQTKFDLAIDTVTSAIEEGIWFKWVCADGGYRRWVR
jgi:hypothetical protein